MAFTDSTIHSAIPDAIRARNLRLSVNELLRKNLGQSIEIARKVFPSQAGAATEILKKLDPARHISPKIFVLHWQLTSALREQNAAQASIALSHLAEAVRREILHADSFTVSTIEWDEIDAATVQYLCRTDGPRGSNGEIPEMLPLRRSDYDNFVVATQEALALLLKAHPEMYGEFQELVTSIRLYEPRHVGSMSSPRSFGVMYIYKPHTEDSLKDLPLYYLNHITHETSHIALNAVMTQGKLILNDPSERFSSPVRPDARPMDGVYHAAFVLSRVALVQSQPIVKERPATAETQETTLKSFWAAYETVAAHGKLTEAGQQVIESCRELVESLEA